MTNWRPIPSFPKYEASSEGQIRRIGKARALAPSASGHGYLKVVVFRGGPRVTRKVHTLVAEAFLGPRPAGHETNHIDCDKHNNAVANLEYVTRAQNMAHASLRGRMAGNGRPPRANS